MRRNNGTLNGQLSRVISELGHTERIIVTDAGLPIPRSDEMAMGVLAALKAQSLAGKVTLVGNDGISDALAAIASGDMYATNAESPYALGQQVVTIALEVIGGKTVADSDQTLEGELVTKDNVKDYAQHLTSIGDAADVPDSLK